MRLKSLLLIICISIQTLLGISLLIGCQSNIESSVVKSVSNSQPSTFVGCRKGLGQCHNSCPERSGHGQEDPDRCPHAQLEGSFACFCGHSTEPLPEEPDADQYYYLGCRVSPGECLNSCSRRQGIALRHPNRCPPELLEGDFACYCRI